MIDELLRDAAGTPMVQGIRDRDSAVVSQSGDAFDQLLYSTSDEANSCIMVLSRFREQLLPTVLRDGELLQTCAPQPHGVRYDPPTLGSSRPRRGSAGGRPRNLARSRSNSNRVRFPILQLQSQEFRGVSVADNKSRLRHRFLPAGDQNAAKRGPKAQVQAKATGMEPGEPDLRLYIAGGRLRMIENKVGRGKLSPDQVQRHEQLAALGHEVVVVRATSTEDAADQAEALVRAWLGANDNQPAATWPREMDHNRAEAALLALFYGGLTKPR